MDGRIADIFASLEEPLVEACQATYGDRLVSLAVFGSVGRGTPGPESDLDLLVVVELLPRGRLARVAEFDPVEDRMRSAIEQASRRGVHTRLSPVFRTPAELAAGSPLLLDMTEDARILLDRHGSLEAVLGRLRGHLGELGARRVWVGSAWYWDLKPDYRWGDVIEL